MKIVFSVCVTFCLTVFCVSADAMRTEQFQLEEGWNAVYLSVEPVDRGVSSVFEGVPVDVVSSFDGTFFMKQFSTDSSVNLLRSLGWETWYSPKRDDSFLTTLSVVHCGKAYLVHAEEACVVSIRGSVEFLPVQWVPDSYNLVGFTLDVAAVPTYAEFFAGSAAHRDSALYCLRNGVWTKVVDPANTAMKSGEAFWIYCDGASDYPGPVSVELGAGGALFLRDGDVMDVVVKNRAPYPLQTSLSHVCPDDAVLPLSVVMAVVGDVWTGVRQTPVDLGEGSWTVDLPPLNAGAGLKVPLQVDASRLAVNQVESLLCIKSDLGTETWVPVTGIREDLK